MKGQRIFQLQPDWRCLCYGQQTSPGILQAQQTPQPQTQPSQQHLFGNKNRDTMSNIYPGLTK